jgi:hypothetical protein
MSINTPNNTVGAPNALFHAYAASVTALSSGTKTNDRFAPVSNISTRAGDESVQIRTSFAAKNTINDGTRNCRHLRNVSIKTTHGESAWRADHGHGLREKKRGGHGMSIIDISADKTKRAHAMLVQSIALKNYLPCYFQPFKIGWIRSVELPISLVPEQFMVNLNLNIGRVSGRNRLLGPQATYPQAAWNDNRWWLRTGPAASCREGRWARAWSSESGTGAGTKDAISAATPKIYARSHGLPL